MTTINRNKCRMWFITFPQSGTYSPEEFLDKLFARRTVTGVAGVQETHEDGSPHIHLNIKLEFGLTKSQILNSCRIKFPEDYKRIDIRSTDSTTRMLTTFIKKEKCSYGNDRGWVAELSGELLNVTYVVVTKTYTALYKRVWVTNGN